jgi:hypothetical protein
MKPRKCRSDLSLTRKEAMKITVANQPIASIRIYENSI